MLPLKGNELSTKQPFYFSSFLYFLLIQDFRKTLEYISIRARLKELKQLRKEFYAPPTLKRREFYNYRQKNPEFNKIILEQLALLKRVSRLNPEYYNKCRIRKRKSDRNIKDKLFELLGGKKCISCGITDERCLQLDHVNGGGLKDYRKFMGHTGRMRAYYILHPEEAKKNLQVMCANCNWIKKYENNENPYQY